MTLDRSGRWTSTAVLLTLLTLLSTRAVAERVNQYQAFSFNATYPALGFAGVGAGDNVGLSFQIPFSFPFDGVTIPAGAWMKSSTNGWIQVGDTTYSGALDIMGRTQYGGTISFFSQDLFCSGGMVLAVGGTAPNRFLVVEWLNIQGINEYLQGRVGFNGQVRIYETSGQLEFYYSKLSFQCTALTGGAGIGLNGYNTPSFQYIYFGSPTSTLGFNLLLRIPPHCQLAYTPRSLDFGYVSTGQNSVVSFDVRNLGPNTTMTVNSATITGASDFQVVSAPATVAPGLASPLQLRFTPANSGVRTATLTLITTGRDSGTRTINLIGYGAVPSMTIVSLDGTPTDQLFRKTRTRLGDSIEQGFLIQSTGIGPLQIVSSILSGDYPSQYRISRMPSAVISEGSTDTLRVRYLPTMEGSRPARIEVTSNAVQKPKHVAQLLGVGILPRLVVSPRSISFDSVGIGETVCRTILLQNVGSDTLVIDKSYLAIADSDFHYVAPEGNIVMPPESERTLELCFTPSHLGYRVARLRLATNIPLTYDVPRRDTSSFTINVSGAGVPRGRLEVAAETPTPVLVRNETCREVTITNPGSAPITVTTLALSGTNATEFRIENATLPFVLAPNASRVVRICVTPQSEGLRDALLTVRATSNGTTLTDDLPLAVTSVVPCVSVPTKLFNEIVLIGQSKSETLTVTNCGEIATDYTLTSDNTAYYFDVLGFPLPSVRTGIIAPGASKDMAIMFKPATRDLNAGTISVTSPELATKTIQLGGFGGEATIGAFTTELNQEVGTSTDPVEIILKNNGNVEWTPGIPQVTGPYTYVSLSGAENPIQPGATGILKFIFTPTQLGVNPGSATFPNSAPKENPTFTFNFGWIGIKAANVTSESEGFKLGQSYPNPSRDEVQVDYTLGTDGAASLNVFDLHGAVVRSVLTEWMPKGEHSLTLRIADLPSGQYRYELTASGVRLSRQMLIVR